MSTESNVNRSFSVFVGAIIVGRYASETVEKASFQYSWRSVGQSNKCDLLPFQKTKHMIFIDCLSSIRVIGSGEHGRRVASAIKVASLFFVVEIPMARCDDIINQMSSYWLTGRRRRRKIQIDFDDALNIISCRKSGKLQFFRPTRVCSTLIRHKKKPTSRLAWPCAFPDEKHEKSYWVSRAFVQSALVHGSLAVADGNSCLLQFELNLLAINESRVPDVVFHADRLWSTIVNSEWLVIDKLFMTQSVVLFALTTTVDVKID